MLPWSLASFAATTLTGKSFNILWPRPLFITGCTRSGDGHWPDGNDRTWCCCGDLYIGFYIDGIRREFVQQHGTKYSFHSNSR